MNPAFPDLEGRRLLDEQDSRGKYLVREMFAVVRRVPDLKRRGRAV